MYVNMVYLILVSGRLIFVLSSLTMWNILSESRDEFIMTEMLQFLSAFSKRGDRYLVWWLMARVASFHVVAKKMHSQVLNFLYSHCGKSSWLLCILELLSSMLCWCLRIVSVTEKQWVLLVVKIAMQHGSLKIPVWNVAEYIVDDCGVCELLKHSWICIDLVALGCVCIYLYCWRFVNCDHSTDIVY